MYLSLFLLELGEMVNKPPCSKGKDLKCMKIDLLGLSLYNQVHGIQYTFVYLCSRYLIDLFLFSSLVNHLSLLLS